MMTFAQLSHLVRPLGRGPTLPLLLLALVLTNVGCDSTAARQQQAVRRASNQLRLCYQDATSSSQVVQKLRAVDLSRCPPDFAQATVAHIHAWEAMAVVEQQQARLKQYSNSGEVFVESFIRGAFGDPFGKTQELLAANSQLQQSYNTAVQQIDQSAQQLELTATRYSVLRSER